jgi:hypothetical protein
VCEIGGITATNPILHMWLMVVVLNVMVPHPHGSPLAFKIRMAIKLCEANQNILTNNLARHGIYRHISLPIVATKNLTRLVMSLSLANCYGF